MKTSTHDELREAQRGETRTHYRLNDTDEEKRLKNLKLKIITLVHYFRVKYVIVGSRKREFLF